MSDTTLIAGTQRTLTAADLSSATSDSVGSLVDSATAAQNLTSDFNTFLTLLTAQVTNQDPLQPLDSTQFVEQLATFSSLEQQVTSNAHLEEVVGLLQQSIAGSSANLLGQEAAASSVQVDSGAFAAQAIRTDTDVEGQLLVFDENDAIVFRGETGTIWSWNGTDFDGEGVPSGTYRFEISTADGSQPAFMVGTVDRVINGDDGLEVGFAQGVSTPNYILNENA